MKTGSSDKERLFEVSLDLLCVVDWEGRFVEANPAWDRILGYSPEELEGRSFLELVHPEDREATEAAHARSREESVVTFRNRYRSREGSWHWLQWSSASVPDEEKVYASARDITRQVEAEEELARVNRGLEERIRRRTAELEKRNREAQEFVFVASHDLREPLRKIEYFGGRLEEKYREALEDRGRDYLRRMRGAAERMGSLIEGLLMLSRVTTRARPLEKVDLSAVARDAVSTLEVALADSGGEVEIGDLPTVEADRIQMRQLLQNLVANGIKYHHPEDSPRITITAEDGDRESIRIAVSDRGIGFDPQHADRILQPFQRLHGRDEFEGTGMGLAICRKIVDRHGGSLSAEGRPGEGATFRITLPRRQDSDRLPRADEPGFMMHTRSEEVP